MTGIPNGYFHFTLCAIGMCFDDDAPGVSAYRAEINDLLRAFPIESIPHEKAIARVDEASRQFNVLVLKTNMAAGHGGSSGRYDYLKEVAFDYAFMLTHLGVEK